MGAGTVRVVQTQERAGRLADRRAVANAVGGDEPRRVPGVRAESDRTLECVVYTLAPGRSLYGDAFDEPGEPELITVAAPIPGLTPRQLVSVCRYSPIGVPCKARADRVRRVSKRRHGGRMRKRRERG